MKIHSIESCKDTPVSPDQDIQKVTINSIGYLKKTFPDRFYCIGSFRGKISLSVKPDASPSIDAPRKYSIHIKAKLMQELDCTEENGVTKKIEHHTDWSRCSSIATSVKKDGSLRVYLDPKRLSDCLKRSPHKIPTLEKFNPVFADARVFSKMDAKVGYWSIHLDDDSQEITTFRKVLLHKTSLWALRLSGSVSKSYGPHTGQSTWMCRDRWWCSGLWSER